MQFLVTHMPDHDLKSLSAEFFLENVRFAYQAWNDSPWKDQLPPGIFLNNVLPYANINNGGIAGEETSTNGSNRSSSMPELRPRRPRS